MIHFFDDFLVPPFTFLLPVSRVYSFITGYGILLIALIIFGYVTTGWQGVLAFVIAQVFCAILVWFIEFLWTRRAYDRDGSVITASERSFFQAFRLIARRSGVSANLEVSEEELQPSHWKHVYYDLAIKWPIVVSRFTDDD